MEIHGGDIISAAKKFNRAVDQWQDISTGINPFSYPYQNIDAKVLQNLPYLTPEFENAVNHYYGSNPFLACNGSQQIIQALPFVLINYPLIAPDIGYREYVTHWQAAGRKINTYNALDHQTAVKEIDSLLADNNRQHLLIINPNNPTGQLFSIQQLQQWAEKLAEGAVLVVDEAFIDTLPENSLLNSSLLDNCLVLRSFGKFFGLAGLRLGFVFGSENLLAPFKFQLGLWACNGVAQAIATDALQDNEWQHAMREQLKATKLHCDHYYRTQLDLPTGLETHTDLFCSYLLSKQQAEECYQLLASEGVLTRVIPVNNLQCILRLGLTKDLE